MLAIFIDALNPKYIEDMPYLKSLKKNSLFGELEIPMAFTGISASFFTGLNPDKHGIMDLFNLSKERQGIQNKYLVNFLRLIQGKRFFYTPLSIEKKRATYFQPCLEKTWPQRNCLKQQTLFDILEKNKKSFISIDWPNYFLNRNGSIFISNSHRNILKLTKKSLSRVNFILTHFLDLEIAHKIDKNSREFKTKLKEIDKDVRELCENYNGDILIFSDHTMNDVKKEIDIEKKISKLNLNFGYDLIYFIGSTIIRFWFKNKTAEKKVIKMLKEIKDGRIIKEKEFNLPKIADTIFSANTGTVFWPNFFLRKMHYKAMHGWNPKKKENKTFYLIKSKRITAEKKNAKTIDLLPTILKLMGLSPIKCDGRSII